MVTVKGISLEKKDKKGLVKKHFLPPLFFVVHMKTEGIQLFPDAAPTCASFVTRYSSV